ncbi:MAG TPA: hypothetical protein VN192_00780 [Flavobacterium sp.]|jgi:hypothetical protein|nr:hypothetical protein [Flavobacterium sp.]
MNFSWRKSVKWGALAGIFFVLLNVFGDYMMLGNSIYEEFFTIKFYKKVVSTIVIWSLVSMFLDWLWFLITKKDLNKQ